MTDPRSIKIADFMYELPEDRIALHPLEKRDDSKLLVFDKGNISESQYKYLDKFISPDTLLVFNNTKVINARLIFKKTTGATIEIFCLEPCGILNEYNRIMSSTRELSWKCLVGGAAKWKDEVLEKHILVNEEAAILQANLIERNKDSFIVKFSWKPADLSFAAVLEAAGDIPLPPYIKRKIISEDEQRYQTIYARHEGSVAAPTAGLHFTADIFNNLETKNILVDYVTLHVGAGTFKPVKSETMGSHKMHTEWIQVDKSLVNNLLLHLDKIITVGTTSLRTIETLYWLGAKLVIEPDIEMPELFQWDIYESPLSAVTCSPQEALNATLLWMEKHGTKTLFTQTQLLITPGYTFRIAKGLITNFHQPGSTLLLLVAAAVGNKWKDIYQYALDHDFRFLSYGDGNLLFF